MAEIKNSFLRSKMNKDLDDRLIPNGEYRDAQNISVGKSEADDIGALETVLGNTLVNNFGLNGFEVIGYKSISNKNKIIVFLTNNTNHYIYSYTPNTTPVLLVTGSFLNFSTSNPITGVSVIESLLFWTDNRNQPRKINLDLAANGSYYTEENHISVAKYNPYKSIGLLQKVVTPTTTNSSTATLLIANTTGIYKGMLAVQYNNANFGAEDYFYVTAVNNNTSVVLNAAPATVNAGDITFLATTMTGENITFDFNQGNDWPGDPDYLESKFVRLSYRFEFDDGEYSLMAPFTQICFIPKQKGYFLGSGETSSGAGDQTPEDENKAYRSTILEFMENGVQNIDLLIPFPDVLSNCQPGNNASYKIKSIDILYKESDQTVVKVIDSIDYNEPFLNNSADTWTSVNNSNILTYNYQSRKPFRTLPTNQTIRVYDKVPVKALAQETAGNRIIYGNFKDKYTSPEFLDYIVGVGPKSLANNYNNWVEYPNHSVKQNRNYQVGFILADKFGRQSDVILSGIKLTSTTAGDGTVYGGDTIYNAFNSTTSDLNNWFGDALKVDIQTPITVAEDDTLGTPGLYANTGTGYNTYQATPSDQPVIIESTTSSDNTAGGTTTSLVLTTANPNITVGMVVTGGGLPAGVVIDTVTNANNFVLNSAQNILANSELTYSSVYIFKLGTVQSEIPTIGSFLEGQFTDYVKVINIKNNTPSSGKYTIATDGQASSIYLQQSPGNPDIKYKYSINSKGWYSYKIVVKQQEQDYYNSYLPGILKGYPTHSGGGTNPFPTNEDSSTGHIVLLNDNINKIPRDLSQVGPDQKQYKSSVQLSLRVTNKLIGGSSLNNVQYFPGILTDTASTIATNSNDLNMAYADLDARGHENIYQTVTNPSIARITFSNNYTIIPGVLDSSNQNANMQPYLAVYETEPQDSLLDIFWETPTVGLISTLNDAIRSNYEGAVGWSTYSSSAFTEAMSGNFLTGLSPVDQSGNNLINTESSTITVVDNNGTDVSSQFSITRTGAGTSISPHLYNFAKVGDNFVYNYDPSVRSYTISMVITNNAPSTPVVSSTLNIQVSLQNSQPVINGGNALPAVNNVNQNFEGTIATITGENGAASSTLKLQQLKWSISGVSPSVYNGVFSINETTGVITKTGTGTNPGTCTLTVKLEDAYNGSALASGSESRTATQQVVVNSAVIGTPFFASDPGVQSQSCHFSGALNSTCGQSVYYNQTSSSPTVGDEIRTGPNGSSSPLAPAFYYSYNCSNTGFGNRNFFKVGTNGIITIVSTC